MNTCGRLAGWFLYLGSCVSGGRRGCSLFAGGFLSSLVCPFPPPGGADPGRVRSPPVGTARRARPGSALFPAFPFCLFRALAKMVSSRLGAALVPPCNRMKCQRAACVGSGFRDAAGLVAIRRNFARVFSHFFLVFTNVFVSLHSVTNVNTKY